MNRKLIRPKLNEVTLRPVDEPRSTGPGPRPVRTGQSNHQRPDRSDRSDRSGSNQGKPAPQQAQRKTPPQDTNAEIFYYKKQIEGHVPMVIVLQDGEKLFGTIEWYDRHALKVNRENEPNIVLLKHNIKYMYKDPE